MSLQKRVSVWATKEPSLCPALPRLLVLIEHSCDEVDIGGVNPVWSHIVSGFNGEEPRRLNSFDSLGFAKLLKQACYDATDVFDIGGV